MRISDWLDMQQAQGIDVSHARIPESMLREEQPDETVFFKEIRPCSILCTGDHPFATVERYGQWYYARGREKEKGPHTTKPQWWMFTRDQNLAVKEAKAHIEDAALKKA